MILWQERIREIQEKYNPSSSNSEDDFNSSAEPESLGFIEDSDLGEEVDERFRNIFDDLEPCKTELTNLEEELKNLKRKFKTPMELIEQSRTEITSDEVDNNNVVTPPHKLLPNIEPSTNKVRASQAVSHQANEADIKHMVCDTHGDVIEELNIKLTNNHDFSQVKPTKFTFLPLSSVWTRWTMISLSTMTQFSARWDLL